MGGLGGSPSWIGSFRLSQYISSLTETCIRGKAFSAPPSHGAVAQVPVPASAQQGVVFGASWHGCAY